MSGFRPFLRAGAAALAGVVLALPALTAPAAENRVVRIDAVLADGGQPVQDAMTLSVWALSPDSAAPALVAERHATPAEVTLSPGRYRIEAVYGELRRVRNLDVTDRGDQRVTVNLRGGQVTFELLPARGVSPVDAPVAWEVRRYARGSESGPLVLAETTRRLSATLQAGWYEVAARHNGSAVNHLVQIDAGRRYDYSLLLGE